MLAGLSKRHGAGALAEKLLGEGILRPPAPYSEGDQCEHKVHRVHSGGGRCRHGSVRWGGARRNQDRRLVDGSALRQDRRRAVRQAFASSRSIVEFRRLRRGHQPVLQGRRRAIIDIANSSRTIRPTELEACAKNGVKDVVEVKFGYDGIVFASDVKGPNSSSSRRTGSWRSLLKFRRDGKLAANTNKTWKQVNAAFPEWKIAAYIPGEKHGTREVFEEKVLHAGW